MRSTPAGPTLERAETIYAQTIARVVEQQRISDPLPEPLALAVPGWWTQGTLARVREALREHEVDAELINEAEAAVAEVQHPNGQLPDTVAVVGLRTALISAVIVHGCRSNPAAAPSPVLVHDEGGAHLDAAVLQHLVRGLHDLGQPTAAQDPATVLAAQEALHQCRELRESLSISANESITPDLPGATHTVRMIRSELDELATPWVESIVQLLATAVERSHRHVGAVLLTGGLATMPLVSQRISADLGLEVHVPEAPQLVTARGARFLLAHRHQRQRKPNALWQLLRLRVPTLRPEPPTPGVKLPALPEWHREPSPTPATGLVRQ